MRVVALKRVVLQKGDAEAFYEVHREKGFFQSLTDFMSSGPVVAMVLEGEDADTVEEATRRAFDGGKHRMVLMTTAGPISEMTPRVIENYHRMIDVWEELSPIE